MNFIKKIFKVSTLKKKISLLRKQKQKIAFTNGCFDILHFGHVSYLQKAKGNDRILIVGLNSDKSVKSIKGPKRPIVPQEQRASVLSALECVDFVVVFDEDTPENLVRALQPDILVKGADWKGKKIAGEDFIKSRGGKVEYVNYVPKCSSTNIIEKIARQCQKR